MPKKTAILGFLLAVSVLVNVLAISRLSDERGGGGGPANGAAKSGAAEAPAPASVVPAPAGRSAAETDLSGVEEEIRTLQEEVKDLRLAVLASGGKSSSDGKSSKADKTVKLAKAVENDPAAVQALADRESLNDLWRSLKGLDRTRTAIGPEKQMSLAMEATREFLGLDAAGGSALEGATRQMMEEIQQARQAMEQAHREVTNDPARRDEAQRLHREISSKYGETRRAAVGRVSALLNDSSRHRQFRDELGRWVRYLEP